MDGGLIWANHLPWIFSDVGQKSQIRSEKTKDLGVVAMVFMIFQLELLMDHGLIWTLS